MDFRLVPISMTLNDLNAQPYPIFLGLAVKRGKIDP